jgi:hypothetical protein
LKAVAQRFINQNGAVLDTVAKKILAAKTP